MKKTTFFISWIVIAFIAIVSIIACQRESEITTDTHRIDSSSIQTFFQTLFENKYNYVTNISDLEADKIKSGLLAVYQSESVFEKNMDEFEYIRAVRSKSEMMYSSTAVQVDIISDIHNESTSIVKIRVFFALKTNVNDEETNEPIIVKGYDIYQFEISKIANSFKILTEQKLDLTNVDQSIMDYINQNPVDLMVSVRSYNGTTAAQWAKDHWNNIPSSGYYDYTNFGGDCTNFESHCNKHGGWVQVNAWHWISNGTSCDYNMTTCQRSPSWTGANQFHSYLTGSGNSRVISKFSGLVLPWYSWSTSQLNTVKVLIKGDIAQLATSGTYHHSMIVTSKTSGSPYIFLTYRNSTGNLPRLDRPVDEIKQSFPYTSETIAGFYVKP